MNPYENLANAIIEQAAKDHRSAVAYLKKHPHTKELSEKVVMQRAEREKRRAELKAKKLPMERIKKSREERLLENIIARETLRYDTEKFFRSSWFEDLTDIDGKWLLERLKRTEGN